MPSPIARSARKRRGPLRRSGPGVSMPAIRKNKPMANMEPMDTTTAATRLKASLVAGSRYIHSPMSA